jgi:glutaminyl-peptide cyclotransferase
VTAGGTAARALLLLALVAAGCERGNGSGQPGVRAVAPPFDAGAAFALLERQVGFGPRVPNSDGHRAQLAWQTAFLRERADSVELQSFQHRAADGVTLQLTNVIARFRPDDPDRILLLAHWDTRPMADYETDPAARARPIPGANDGASGVAVLLQLADMFARRPPPVGVDILLTDGEDYGGADMYLGARHFAANLPAGYRPLYGVLVDMVADRNPVFPQEAYSLQFAPEVVERVWRVAHELGWGHVFPRTAGMAVEDDHVPLNRAGIRTINIIDFEYGPGNRYWHTLEDDLHNVGPAGLEAVGSVLAELVYRGG